MDRFIHKHRTIVQWTAVAIPSLLVLFLSLFRDAGRDHPYVVFVPLAALFIFVFYLQAKVSRLDRESSYAQQLAVYQFSSSPKVVTGAFYEEQGSDRLTQVNRCDTHAAELVKSQLARVGCAASRIIACSHDDLSPKTFSAEDVVLVCGPVGNSLSRELNRYLREERVNAFHFADSENADLTAHRSEGKANWTISHGLFSDVRIAPPSTGKDDYGVIFVGRNPQAKDLWLIWLAGLGAEGTVGAARALVDPRIQAQIADQLRFNDFVSALIKWKFEKWDRGEVDSILFSPHRIS